MKTARRLGLSLSLSLLLGMILWTWSAQAVFYFKPDSEDINAIGIQVTAAPGVTTKGYIYLANEDEGDGQRYEVYTVDAEMKADGSYGALNSEKNTQKQVGLWAKLESNKVQVDNAKMKLLTVTFTIPEDIQPGKYQGGIVATQFSEEASASGGAEGNASIKTVIRNGASIFLTIVPKDQYISPEGEEEEVVADLAPTAAEEEPTKTGFNKMSYAIGGGIIALAAVILAAIKYLKKS